MDLDTRVAHTIAYFERVHREVFAGDPAANPKLTVRVVDATDVDGIDTIVLIAPWTVNGMFFPETDRYLPDELEIGGRRHPVFANRLEEIGRYGSVNLVPDVSCQTMDTIVATLDPIVPWFQDSIHRFYAAMDVANPDRRALLFGRNT